MIGQLHYPGRPTDVKEPSRRVGETIVLLKSVWIGPVADGGNRLMIFC